MSVFNQLLGWLRPASNNAPKDGGVLVSRQHTFRPRFADVRMVSVGLTPISGASLASRDHILPGGRP